MTAPRFYRVRAEWRDGQITFLRPVATYAESQALVAALFDILGHRLSQAVIERLQIGIQASAQ